MPMATSTKKHLSATVYYLLTGVALGWPGLLATGVLLAKWRSAITLAPLSLATLHLMVLGLMLTVAFGVLYQIIPIAFQATPVPRHVLYWHLPLHTLSVVLMVIGFLLMRFDLVAIGGSALVCAAIAYFVLIGRSYVRARNKTPVHKGLSLPFASLGLVLLAGLFQAIFPSDIRQGLLMSHVLLGGFAFWGGLVLVFSYKLVPMFAISHGYKASLPRSATPYFIGTVLWIVASWIPAQFTKSTLLDIGALAIFVGLVAYTVDIVAIVRARKRRRIVVPLFDAFASIICLLLGQTGILCSITLHIPHLLLPSIYLFSFGGLIGLMFSFMQKMVPFLWFEYRFSKRPERKTAPLIDDMVSRRIAQSGMVLYFLGVVIGFFDLLSIRSTTPTPIDWMSAICLTLGSILLFIALRQVLTIGGRRPDDDIPA